MVISSIGVLIKNKLQDSLAQFIKLKILENRNTHDLMQIFVKGTYVHASVVDI